MAALAGPTDMVGPGALAGAAALATAGGASNGRGRLSAAPVSSCACRFLGRRPGNTPDSNDSLACSLLAILNLRDCGKTLPRGILGLIATAGMLNRSVGGLTFCCGMPKKSWVNGRGIFLEVLPPLLSLALQKGIASGNVAAFAPTSVPGDGVDEELGPQEVLRVRGTVKGVAAVAPQLSCLAFVLVGFPFLAGLGTDGVVA